MWTEQEKAAVERHLQQHILTGKTPDKAACERCLAAEPLLEGRDWKGIKYFVKNKASALKKKMSQPTTA